MILASGWACLARFGERLAIDGTTRLLLVGAIDFSTTTHTTHRLKTSDVSTGVQFASALY
jgi:hypothetical protein